MSKGIASIARDRLKQALRVTLAASTVLLILYTAFSVRAREHQAARFLLNHVSRLAQAGVDSQNVNDVDLEVARFAQTWKETQDLPVRTAVFLDGKLVSRSGQLQAFSWMSMVSRQVIDLPSGEKLSIELELDTIPAIRGALFWLVASWVTILLLFLYLRSSMESSVLSITEPLESTVRWLKEIAKDLPGSAQNAKATPRAGVVEIDELGESVGSLTHEIVSLSEKLTHVNFDRGRLRMAEQVAHNLKGVISSLQLRISGLPATVHRQGLEECLRHLRDLSEGLLASRKQAAERPPVSTGVGVATPLEKTVRSAVAEKQAQYRNLTGAKIRVSVLKEVELDLVSVSTAQIRSIVSNLIDNSVEALQDKSGHVDIMLHCRSVGASITVQDDGCGISADVLPLVMTDGFSYGKSGGNGIGLSHAKEIVELARGKITIRSEKGRSTEVKIELPWKERSAAPLELKLSTDTTIVCIDDDPIIHQVWKKVLRAVSHGPVLHFDSAASFENWIGTEGAGSFGSRLYLFDFDLESGHPNGLDLIQKYGLALESVLVSGLVEAADVEARLLRMGVRSIAKDQINDISFGTTDPVVPEPAMKQERREAI